MAIDGLRRLFHLVVRPFRGGSAVDAEIGFHLEQQVRDLVNAGWTADAAREEATRRFGDLNRYREALVTIDRETAARRGRREWLADLGQDLRFAARLLARSPGFTVAVVITLGLGIGANATMFGLVDRLLFKPPAHVVSPDRVARLVVTEVSPDWGSFSNMSVSYLAYQAQRREARRIDGVAAYFTSLMPYDRGENARQLRTTLATAAFFPLLGVEPRLGRFYTEDQDQVGSPPVAVISERLWRRELGGSSNVLGKTLFLGRRLYSIIGVAPAGFTGIDLDAVDAWLPLNVGGSDVWGRDPSDAWRTQDGFQWIKLVARLPEGGDRAGAGAEAAQVYRRARLLAEPSLNRDSYKVSVVYAPVIAARGAEPSKSALVAALLAGVSLLVLLIACANVANLFLARGVSRRREIAVRLALGIRRGRLLRMLLLESAVLCLFGAGLALVVARTGGDAVRRFLLPNIEFAESPVDLRVLIVTLAAMGVTLLIVGLVPALQASRPELSHSLKLGGAGGGLAGDRRQRRLRTGLLVAQAILSVLLLVGAGLFVRSFQRASSLDLGFDPGGVVVAEIDLGLADYSRERAHQFLVEARDRMAAFPGVERASLAMAAPFWTRFTKDVSIPGRDSLPRFPGGAPRVDAVSPEHFATIGIRIRQGRGFTSQDRAGSAPVLVVNETLAKAYWPGEAAVGRCMKVGGDSTPCREVVGVVDDVRFEDLVEPATGRYWVPLDQSQGFAPERVLYLKAKGDPRALVADVRRALQSMAPNLPRANVRPLATHLDPLLEPWRLGATMFGLFGLLALLVSVVGLYSVLAYAVAQRSREFGVRTALGASAAQLRGLVLRQGLGVVVAGLSVGVGLALVASHWLQPLLFQTSGRDPLVFGGVTVILLGAACLACLAPAERAGRVDPMEALRSE